MIKRLLKILFPVGWLKNVFLIYNKLKIRTIDKLLFPAYLLLPKDFIIQRDVAVYDALNINENQFSENIRNRLALWHDWTQDEYLLVFDKPNIIEPRQGWAMANGKLIYPSLGFSRAAYVHKPDFWELHSSGKKIEYLDEIISLRDTGEENYFHLYNDILAKLCFLEDTLSLSRSVPLLISQKLYDKPYFQYFLKHSEILRDRQYIIQTDCYIQAKRTYFCKPLTHTKAYLDQMVNSLPTVGSSPAFSDRIFLTRHPKRLRYIENMEEVHEVCRQQDIEVVDADHLTMEEQINLFKYASLVLGIHGAGLTNMIYGAHSIQKIIEIFPPMSYMPFHYIMLASMYGFEYDAILGNGDKLSKQGGFTINVKQLRHQISSTEKTTS